jgi:hypothetical protein
VLAARRAYHYDPLAASKSLHPPPAPACSWLPPVRMSVAGGKEKGGLAVGDRVCVVVADVTKGVVAVGDDVAVDDV